MLSDDGSTSFAALALVPPEQLLEHVERQALARRAEQGETLAGELAVRAG